MLKVPKRPSLKVTFKESFPYFSSNSTNRSLRRMFNLIIHYTSRSSVRRERLNENPSSKRSIQTLINIFEG